MLFFCARSRLNNGHGKAGAFFQPQEQTKQADQRAAEEHGLPAEQKDQNRRDEVDKHGSQGTADAHMNDLVLVGFYGEQHQHGFDQRRPHKCLGKPIDAPHHCHGSGIGAEGDQQVHGACGDKTHGKQLFWMDSVTKIATDELPEAVGKKAAGQCHGKLRFFHPKACDHLGDHGAVVGSCDIADKIDKRTQKHKLSDLSTIFKLGDSALTIWKFADAYSDLESKIDVIQNNINILDDIIAYSNDVPLVIAAREIRAATYSELNQILLPILDVVVGKTFSKTSEGVICLLTASQAAQATVFWVVVAKNLIDVTLGVSDMSKKVVQLMAISDACEITKNQLIKQLSKDNGEYYMFDENDLYKFRQTLLIRRAGEQKYIDALKKNAISDFLFGWLDNYEQEKELCENNCLHIDRILEIYSQTSINNRRIQCIK